MSTRSEQYHADEQRRGETKPRSTKRSKPGAPPKRRTQAKKRASRKASHTLEPVPAGKHRSRISTRKSANRAKTDTSFNLTEQLEKGSPEARFRRARSRAARVRSGGGT